MIVGDHLEVGERPVLHMFGVGAISHDFCVAHSSYFACLVSDEEFVDVEGFGDSAGSRNLSSFWAFASPMIMTST